MYRFPAAVTVVSVAAVSALAGCGSGAPPAKPQATSIANVTATRTRILSGLGEHTLYGFSDDGGTLMAQANAVIQGVEPQAQVWNAATGASIVTAPGASVANISPDGRFLATGDRNGVVQLWNLTANRDVTTLDQTPSQVVITRFSPDSRFLVTATVFNSQVKLWDVANGREIGSPIEYAGTTAAVRVALSADGKYLATTDGPTIDIWETATARHVAAMTAQAEIGSINRIELSADAGLVMTADSRGNANVWNVEQKKQIKQLPGGATFSPDGKLLAVPTGENEIQLWDPYGARQVGVLTGGKSGTIAFSRDGRIMSASTQSGTLEIWDVAARKHVASLPIGEGQRGQLSPDGRHLASTVGTGAADEQVQLWDVNIQTR